MPLAPGDAVPTVSAPNQHGESVTLPGDAPAVVYFYPADDTPGCTVEAEEFETELDAYRDAGVDVYGVSADDVESHAAFAEKYDLDFDLLADPDGAVADAFDVERRPSGRTNRTTFIVVDGSVHGIVRNVDPSGHARDVLDYLVEQDIAQE